MCPPALNEGRNTSLVVLQDLPALALASLSEF